MRAVAERRHDLLRSLRGRLERLEVAFPRLERLTLVQLAALDEALGASYGRGFFDGNSAPDTRHADNASGHRARDKEAHHGR